MHFLPWDKPLSHKSRKYELRTKGVSSFSTTTTPAKEEISFVITFGSYFYYVSPRAAFVVSQ